MEADFYRTALEVEGIEETLIPDTSGREFVNSLIYEELCRGIFREESRKDLHSLFDELIDQGADGIVLGCTELPMLLLSGRTERPQMFHRNIPLFDSMDIHCQSAIRWMLDKDPATIDKKGRKR